MLPLGDKISLEFIMWLFGDFFNKNSWIFGNKKFSTFSIFKGDIFSWNNGLREEIFNELHKGILYLINKKIFLKRILLR